MTRVFLVEFGEYSGRYIYGIYSTREKAEAKAAIEIERRKEYYSGFTRPTVPSDFIQEYEIDE